MRYPSEAVAARLLLRLTSPDRDAVPRYVVRAPDGRCFEDLDLPALARLYHAEGVGPGWQIATV